MDVSDNPIADQLYKDIFFHSPLGIYTLDGEGIITSFNPKMAQLSGDKPENAIGLNALHLESYKRVGLDKLFRRGIQGEPFETEVEYQSHLANKRTIRHYRGVPIKDSGIIGQSRLLLIVEDITQRKVIEFQLQNAAQFTAENTNPLLRIGAEGQVLLTNLAADTITQGYGSFVLTYLKNAATKALKINEKVSLDIEHQAQIYLFEVVPNKEKKYANLYGRDVTEERKNQEIRDHFISVTSHELRTPMTVIRGYIEIMLQGVPGAINQSQREYLEKILRSVKDLIAFVNDTLDLSKIQSGELEIILEPLPLVKIVHDVANILQELFDDAGVRLVVPDNELTAIADRAQLSRVLTNLLSNAMKFTPPGGEVRIDVFEQEGEAVIAVKDNGIGMSEEDQKVLFQKYAQIESKWVSKMRGTGLGLAISKDLVERMKGKIWVESQLNKGSTFYVSLGLATSSHGTIG